MLTRCGTSLVLETLQDDGRPARELRRRHELAIDPEAIAAVAFHCLEYGEWHTKSIPYSEGIYCPRCAPA